MSESDLKTSRFTSDAELDAVSSLSARRSSLLSRRDSKVRCYHNVVFIVIACIVVPVVVHVAIIIVSVLLN